jgi:hypothetical protein
MGRGRESYSLTSFTDLAIIQHAGPVLRLDYPGSRVPLTGPAEVLCPTLKSLFCILQEHTMYAVTCLHIQFC